jgi:S1-C subfamily serine protease
MLGFNWIDGIILVLLAAAVIEGLRIGFLSQILVIAGFFSTLFVAGWLFPHLLPIHDATLRTVVNASLVLLVAAYAAVRCLDLGQYVHWSFRIGKLTHDRKLKKLETVLGGLPGLAAGLVLVWLLAVAIVRLPFAGFSNSVSDSQIVQQLTHALPPVPAVFAQFSKRVNPNAQPYVFAQPKPQVNFNYSAQAVRLAESKASGSVVRITSFACGGVASGSGFVVGKSLVATNAHVIAGVKRPIIKYKDGSYEGYPVVFDANLDIAILRVSKLAAPALPLAPQNVPLNSTVAVLGYPGGNYRVTAGIIRDTLAVSARTIYDQGAFGRGVYVLQAHVDLGNSGGPVVLQNGQAAGMLFSKSPDLPNYSYAVTSVHIANALHRAQSSYRRVGTGACEV